MNSAKNKKFSLLHLIVVSLLSVGLTLGVIYFFNGNDNSDELNSHSSAYCSYNIKRMNGFKFIKPIMFVDEECESMGLEGTRQKVIEIINKNKDLNNITSASFYLRDYGRNEWTSVNDVEKYEPGSLFKVPVMIAILKMEEESPGFINKPILYNKAVEINKHIEFKSKSIQLGQTYTVKELLTYMIKYSDNNATVLLESLIKPEKIQKIFSDIGVEVPNVYASQYFFNVKDYSLFIRAIYNAGYLSMANSELAAEILSQCEFKDGIVRGLPSNTRLIHKFGESGNQVEKQLHESAIIYLNNKSYLLTVMTKGNDMNKLSNVIAELSSAVYEEMLNRSGADMM